MPNLVSMDISDNGIALIKQNEGLRLKVYADVAGHLTVGYGHKDDSMTLGDTITQDQADQFLQDDIAAVVSGLNSALQVTVTQNQFDALCDFAFNLGLEREETSTMFKLINQGDFADAANQFPLWCHAGGVVVQDLVNRRAQEQALFLSSD